jgi:hypothetical protein
MRPISKLKPGNLIALANRFHCMAGAIFVFLESVTEYSIEVIPGNLCLRRPLALHDGP